MADNIKITFLGTNGWYTTQTGNTTCVFIETEKAYIVLDAGNGINKLDQYIKDDTKPVYLCLSHFHIDHISGIHTFAKFRFPQGMTILCFKGGKKILDNIIKQPYTIALDDLPFKVQVKELNEGKDLSFSFGLETREMPHSSKCFAYRFDFDGKIVAFCTDAGYCENAVKIAENADLLISECTLKPGQKTEEWPHLNPEDAATLAKEAGVKKLILMHFDAEIYRTLEERKDSEKVASKIFKNVIVAQDDMVIEI
ncbi:MAG: ribonuclease Z [Candidatus Omnitrophota bacterium]